MTSSYHCLSLWLEAKCITIRFFWISFKNLLEQGLALKTIVLVTENYLAWFLETFEIINGVSQGDVLTPLLFNNVMAKVI